MDSVQPLAHVWTANSHSACANCGLHGSCLPAGLNARELARLDSLITPHHRIPGSSYLCHAGTELQSLFAIRSGSLKSSVTDKDERQQIMGFYLAGELLGMDAIGTGKHVCDLIALALEDSEVCKIPFAELQQLSRDIPTLQRHFHCIMSREIARDYGVMLLLGSMRAEQRLATFLLNLSHRFLARGYSHSQLVLRMTRKEIGSYLGLKLETVCRMLTRLQRGAMIVVQDKEIRLIDREKLKAVMQGVDPRLGAPLVNGAAKVMMNKFPARMPPAHALATPVLI